MCEKQKCNYDLVQSKSTDENFPAKECSHSENSSIEIFISEVDRIIGDLINNIQKYLRKIQCKKERIEQRCNLKQSNQIEFQWWTYTAGVILQPQIVLKTDSVC